MCYGRQCPLPVLSCKTPRRLAITNDVGYHAMLMNKQLPISVNTSLTTTASSSSHWSRTASSALSTRLRRTSHRRACHNHCTRTDCSPQHRPSPYPYPHPRPCCRAQPAVGYRSLRSEAVALPCVRAVRAWRRWVGRVSRAAASKRHAGLTFAVLVLV